MKDKQKRKKEDRTWAEAARMVLEKYSDAPMTPRQILSVIETEEIKETRFLGVEKGTTQSTYSTRSGSSPLACLNAVLHSNSRPDDGIFYKLPGRINLFTLKKNAHRWSKNTPATEGEDCEDSADLESCDSTETSTASGEKDASLDETSSNASCSTESQSKPLSPSKQNSHRAIQQVAKQKKKGGMLMPRVVLTPLKVNGEHMESAAGFMGRSTDGETSSTSSSCSVTASGSTLWRKVELASSPSQHLQNIKKSTTGQMKRNRGEEIDFETPGSILVNTNIRALINNRNFAILPTTFQQRLLLLLPEVDRQTGPDGLPRLSSSALNNEFFTHAAQSWKERLADGEFTHEMQVRLRQEMEKEKKTEHWKEKFFEDYYGQISGLSKEESEQQTSVQDDVQNKTAPSVSEVPAKPQRSTYLRHKDGRFKKRSRADLRCRARKTLYRERKAEAAATAMFTATDSAENKVVDCKENNEGKSVVNLSADGESGASKDLNLQEIPLLGKSVSSPSSSGCLEHIPKVPHSVSDVEDSDTESKDQKRKSLESMASTSFPEKKPRLDDCRSFRNTIGYVSTEKPEPTKEEPKVPPIRIQLSRIKPPWEGNAQPTYRICPRIIPNTDTDSLPTNGARTLADIKARALQVRARRGATGAAASIGGGGGPGGGGGSPGDGGGGRNGSPSNNSSHGGTKRTFAETDSNQHRTQLLQTCRDESESVVGTCESAFENKNTCNGMNSVTEHLSVIQLADATAVKRSLDGHSGNSCEQHFVSTACTSTEGNGEPDGVKPCVSITGWSTVQYKYKTSVAAKGEKSDEQPSDTEKETFRFGHNFKVKSGCSEHLNRTEMLDSAIDVYGKHEKNAFNSSLLQTSNAVASFPDSALTKSLDNVKDSASVVGSVPTACCGSEGTVCNSKTINVNMDVRVVQLVGSIFSKQPCGIYCVNQKEQTVAGNQFSVQESLQHGRLVPEGQSVDLESMQMQLECCIETKADNVRDKNLETCRNEERDYSEILHEQYGSKSTASNPGNGSADSTEPEDERNCRPLDSTNIMCSVSDLNAYSSVSFGNNTEGQSESDLVHSAEGLYSKNQSSSPLVIQNSKEKCNVESSKATSSVEASNPLVTQLLQGSLPLEKVLSESSPHSESGISRLPLPDVSSLDKSGKTDCSSGNQLPEYCGTKPTDSLIEGQPKYLKGGPEAATLASSRHGDNMSHSSMHAHPVGVQEMLTESGCAGIKAKHLPLSSFGNSTLAKKLRIHDVFQNIVMRKHEKPRQFSAGDLAASDTSVFGQIPYCGAVADKPQPTFNPITCGHSLNAEVPQHGGDLPVGAELQHKGPTHSSLRRQLSPNKACSPRETVLPAKADWPSKRFSNYIGVKNENIPTFRGSSKSHITCRKAVCDAGEFKDQCHEALIMEVTLPKLLREQGKALQHPLVPSSIPSQLNIQQQINGKLSKLPFSAPNLNLTTNSLSGFSKNIAGNTIQLNHKTVFAGSHCTSSPAQTFAENSAEEEVALRCSCSLKAMIMCKGCGAFCHDECIGPSKLCVLCLVVR
ncbi:polycomb group protein ASXL1 [Protopterus annectens]|uniref:polycomb group protein ASXL1 n=1 Tax=Protopterus annectens TaxID=7888 RepID=UPI001CF9E91D|nr:polycomb group protein ASXL1 [Protopterus annectens]